MATNHMHRCAVADIIALFTCHLGCRHRVSITKTSSPWCLVWDHFYLVGCGNCNVRAAKTWQIVKVTQYTSEREVIDACIRLLVTLRSREGWSELPTTPLFG
jgi:hypothetical protein